MVFDGITMAEKFQLEKGFKDNLINMIEIQKKINKIEDLKLLRINAIYKKFIDESSLDAKFKNTALKFLEEIEDKNNLCHLDYHPLNIMYSNNKYIVIDWCNAKLGNPIYDYARTYIILFEFALRLSKTYLSLIEKDSSIDTKDLNKAIYISVLLRYRETKNDKLLKLLKSLN